MCAECNIEAESLLVNFFFSHLQSSIIDRATAQSNHLNAVLIEYLPYTDFLINAYFRCVSFTCVGSKQTRGVSEVGMHATDEWANVKVQEFEYSKQQWHRDVKTTVAQVTCFFKIFFCMRHTLTYPPHNSYHKHPTPTTMNKDVHIRTSFAANATYA